MGGTFMYPLLRDFLPPSLFQDLWIRLLIPSKSEPTDPRLKTTGLMTRLNSPIGISSGLDLEGRAVGKLIKLGLGFVEIGPAAPTSEYFPSEHYKLTEESLERVGPISSFGALWVKKQLMRQPQGPRGVDLVPLRENIDSVPHTTDDDYIFSVNKLYSQVDYFSFNLCASEFLPVKFYQKTARLTKFLENITSQRFIEIGLRAAENTGLLPPEHEGKSRKIYTPFYIKVNQNWQDPQILEELVETCVKFGIDGLIVGNEEENIEKSREILEKVCKISRGRLEIISFGGIRTGKEVLERLKRGARLVQIFSILLEKGPQEYQRIHQEFLEALSIEGYPSLQTIYQNVDFD
jgi:dihydroorotate dehydrogenase